MHLCYLLPPIEFFSPESGGALATFTWQQGRRMAAKGHRVSVIAPHEGEKVYPLGEFFGLSGVTRNSLSPAQRFLSTKVRRRVANYDWLYFEHYVAAFERVLKRIQPDAVLCFNDWQSPLAIKKAAPQARIFLRLSNECRTRLESVEPTIAACEKIFTVSSYIRDWTQQQFGLSAESDKFQLLYNGADLDSFFPVPDFLTRTEAPTSPVRALFLSRIDPNKGYDLAAQAVIGLRQSGLPVTLDMVGNVWFGKGQDNRDHPLIQRTNELVAQTGGQWFGHVGREELPVLVREHDVLLLPVRNPDPMPQVVFEAMASGLAIVSCSLGGLPEACGDVALWAEPGNADSVAAQLRLLLENRKLLAQRKEMALERARLMTWDANAAIYEEILNR